MLDKTGRVEEFLKFKGKKAVYNVNEDRKVFIDTINNVIDTKIFLKSDKEKIEIDINNITKANLEY